MAKKYKRSEATVALDISFSTDLRRLAEDVNKTGLSKFLKVGKDQIARIVPIVRHRRVKRNISKDNELFLSSAGGWKGIVDVDKFLRDNEESRKISTSPQVKL